MSKWTIDLAHSEVQFKVKHLMISTVTGSFKKFEGEAETDSDDFKGASIRFSIDTASVDTNQEQRDGHLRSPEFFDSVQFPNIEFVSTEFNQKAGQDYVLKGNLTIKGASKAVELAADFGGITKDSYGNTKAGFELTGTINRKDYGLTWNATTELGAIMLGDDVKLIISVQLAKQA
jgi:polyisoprenoid-binding protein YceI